MFNIREFTNIFSPAFPTRLVSLFITAIIAVSFYFGFTQSSLSSLAFALALIPLQITSFLFLYALEYNLKSESGAFYKGFGKYESLSVIISFVITLLSLVLLVTISASRMNIIKTDNYILMFKDHLPIVILQIFSLIIFKLTYYLQKRNAEKYNIKIIKYFERFWKTVSNAQLVLTVFVLAQAILQMKWYLQASYLLDIWTAISLLIFVLMIPFIRLKDSLKHILERNLPEELQYDILSCIADNFNEICQYKTFHSFRKYNKTVIEITVVLPHDTSLDEKFNLENRIKLAVQEKHPDVDLRLYAAPCDNVCKGDDQVHCPLKKTQQKD